MQNSYTVKEVARILGVSPKQVAYFQKKHLIEPTDVEKAPGRTGCRYLFSAEMIKKCAAKVHMVPNFDAVDMLTAEVETKGPSIEQTLSELPGIFTIEAATKHDNPVLVKSYVVMLGDKYLRHYRKGILIGTKPYYFDDMEAACKVANEAKGAKVYQQAFLEE